VPYCLGSGAAQYIYLHATPPGTANIKSQIIAHYQTIIPNKLETLNVDDEIEEKPGTLQPFRRTGEIGEMENKKSSNPFLFIPLSPLIPPFSCLFFILRLSS
jgi:hypothetical protein